LGNGDENGVTDFTVGTVWTLVSAPLNATRDHSALKLEIYSGTAGKDLYVDAGTFTTSNQDSGPFAFTDTPTPTISGTVRVGSTLTAVPGIWGPAPVSLSFEWLRDGKRIAGATQKSYVLTAADLGTSISVNVTGDKPGYSSYSRTSAGTSKVLAGLLTQAPVPTVSGTSRVGSTLTATGGTWAPAPVTLSLQWLRDGAPIAGATKSTYSLVAADLGAVMSVRVTGSKAGYTTVARTSAGTAKVLAAVAVSGPVPSVSGTVRVGQTLTAKPGAWLPAPVALAYQWLRNGKAVAGATKSTYMLVAADLGAVMSVRVTGSKAGYSSVSKVSAGTAKVLAAVAVSGPAPSISGTVRVGKVLTVRPGTWQPAPVTLAYQWLRDGAVIGGASKSTYALSAADLGAVISVRVSGSRPGYASVVRVSKATSKVVAGVLSGVKPKVSGKAKVGRTLSVKAGVWKPVGVVLAYQWLRNGKKIAGATGPGYLVVKADKGKKLTVKVTGTLAGYTTLAKTSKKTAKIK
jgi:hypothetical protein